MFNPQYLNQTFLKGGRAVDLISTDPPFLEWHAQFTTATFKCFVGARMNNKSVFKLNSIYANVTC